MQLDLQPVRWRLNFHPLCLDIRSTSDIYHQSHTPSCCQYLGSKDPDSRGPHPDQCVRLPLGSSGRSDGPDDRCRRVLCARARPNEQHLCLDINCRLHTWPGSLVLRYLWSRLVMGLVVASNHPWRPLDPVLFLLRGDKVHAWCFRGSSCYPDLQPPGSG